MRLRLKINGATCEELTVDGEPVNWVKTITIICPPCELPQITMEVLATELDLEIEGVQDMGGVLGRVIELNQGQQSRPVPA